MTLDCSSINLKRGSKGGQVTELQKGLKTLGYYTTYQGHNLIVDGVFGPATQYWVKQFQKNTGHTQDGVFGPKTCKSFNQKLNAQNGIITTNNNNPMTTTSEGTTAVQVTRTNPYVIDVSKNVVPYANTNITIQGLRFMITSITFDTPTNNGEWKSIELMDGHFYTSRGHDVARAYTFETHMKLREYKRLESELDKLEKQVCTVVCDYFKSGKFTVKVTPALENVKYMKLTFKLTEYY